MRVVHKTGLILSENTGKQPLSKQFVEHYASVYPRMYSFVYSIVGNRSDADDVMQNVSVLLWQKFDQFQEGTSFFRWGMAFAVNLVRNFCRKKRKNSGQMLSEEIMQKLILTQSGSSEFFELRIQQLKLCLSKLSTEDRELIETCYHKEDRIIHYSQKHGVSHNSVYTRLRKIRKQLHTCITRSLGIDGGDAE